MFTNNEINELQYAIEMIEVVLNKNGLLVIEAKSEFEKNLVKKIVFRNAGNVALQSSEANSQQRNMWQTLSDIDDTTIFIKI